MRRVSGVTPAYLPYYYNDRRSRPLPTTEKKPHIHRAYELWERAGKPDGRDEEFYHQAEKELNEGAAGEEKSETFLE
jgi:hypothetical protein